MVCRVIWVVPNLNVLMARRAHLDSRIGRNEECDIDESKSGEISDCEEVDLLTGSNTDRDTSSLAHNAFTALALTLQVCNAP